MRRRRYREPVFSGGFTAFLLVLVLIACGITLYFVVSGNSFGGIGTPAGYESGTGRVNGNAAEDITGEMPNTEPDDTSGETSGAGYGDISNETSSNGYVETGNTGDENPGTPVVGDFDFVLLTEVDNSLLPWYLKLVNRYNFLDYYFLPQLMYIGGGHQFDKRAYRALLDMLDSARSEGLSPIVVSSFRSVSRQTTLFNNRVQRNINYGYNAEAAFEAARRVVAYPGTSEHNLGLAVDIVANSYHGLTARQAETAENIWLAANAHRYGFVMRYPYYHQHITNIIFEPWHFRYVGVYAATEMFNRGIVLEEFVSELLQNQ